jgi:hypothetical protein
MGENRKFRREKRRAACEFRVEGKSQPGILANLSARGLFIQSSVIPPEGCQVLVTLHDPAYGEMELWGRVVRTKTPHRSISNVIPGGFGIAIDSAPSEYFDLLIALGLG